MAVAVRCFSRSGGGAIANFDQYPHAGLQVMHGYFLQKFVPQLTRGLFDFLHDRIRLWLEMDGFAAAIVVRTLAFDPAICFQFA
jgi:hypothetical protein